VLIKVGWVAGWPISQTFRPQARHPCLISSPFQHPPPKQQQAIREAEAAARAAEAAAAETSEIAEVIEAIKRSPIMLELPANHPGLEAVAELVSWLLLSSLCLQPFAFAVHLAPLLSLPARHTALTSPQP